MIKPAFLVDQTSRPMRSVTRYISQALVLLAVLSGSAASLANSQSDLLIVVDQDGVGYTAQLTVFTDEKMIVSRIPSKRKNFNTVFSGPNSAVYERAHERRPDKLTVISGGVFTRFRHRFVDSTDDFSESEDNLVAPVKRTTLDEFATTMADSQALVYRVSWVLPPNIELVDHGVGGQREALVRGTWTQQGNSTLVFEQTGGTPSQLWLEYRVHSPGTREQACLAHVGASQWCSPDSDGDGVPDDRDMCVADIRGDVEPSFGQIPNEAIPGDIVLADNDSTSATAEFTAGFVNADSLGCDDDTRIVLSQIQFESGQTYLNVKSRTSLNKLATALQRTPDRLYRIASYTDNAGNYQNNQSLSENRASAIRHYLMLRGVGPNQIQARGYGESQPAYDNSTAAGRRSNRRVELQLLN